MDKKLSDNKLAVSSVVGIVIMLAITLLSIGIMILYTLPAIDSMQDMAKTQKTEQAFTVFDSRTSKAALGESPLQTTELSLMGGGIEIMGDDDAYNESQIMIVMLSSDSSWYDLYYQNHTYWEAWKNYEAESDFAGIDADMGKILYTYEDRTVAYEGGGIWSKYEYGGTIMTSPPEFHFNGETLTLPIMKIIGNSSVSGTTDAAISIDSSNNPEILFPNASHNSIFVNPLDLDKIIIYIRSDYYDGWAEYAETLISTSATLDDENKTAILELDTIPEMGTFPITQNFKIAQLNESNPEPMENFSYYFVAVSKDSSDFDSIKKIYITLSAGTKYMEYTLTKNRVEFIKYTDSSVGSGNDWEIWVDTKSSDPDYNVFPIEQSGDKNANCTYDLLDDTYVMKYGAHSDGSDPEWSWDEISSTRMSPNVTIGDYDRQTLYNITQHYCRLIGQEGTIDGTWEEDIKNNKINLGDSDYTLIYDTGGGIITFLHVTSNELEATVD